MLAAEPIIDDPVQGNTTATNADKLSTPNRRPMNVVEESVVFIIIFEVEAMLRKEKAKASVSTTYVDLKPSVC